jgi:hypothetical protein
MFLSENYVEVETLLCEDLSWSQVIQFALWIPPEKICNAVF